MHVPSHCDLEVLAFLRNSIHRLDLEPGRATDALSDYVALPLTRHGHNEFLQRIFELRDNFSPYDAVYVALAEGLDATLVTCDLRLTRAARQLTDLNVVGVGAQPGQ